LNEHEAASAPRARGEADGVRALLVAAEPPLPEGGAAGRCAVGLLRGLVANGVEIRVLAARQWSAMGGEPPADLPVEIVEVPPETPGWRGRLERVERPRGHLSRGTFGARVRALAADVDVVHLEETQTGWCSAGLRAPAVVHVHHLALADRGWPAPWTAEFRKLLELVLSEHAVARRHRYLLASSSRVAAQLRRWAPRTEVVVAPLTLDPALYPPVPLDGPPVAGIIGTAAWPPTRAATLRLLERVWPAILRDLPGARLRVAGRGMASLVGPEAPAGVEIVGDVASAADFLSGLSLLLYPLPRGSGMKVKVLESIASGLPVVTTADGAEGIDAGGVVVRDDDHGLAAAAHELLADVAARRDAGHAARSAFLSRYAPAPATAPVADLYRRMGDG
jgi:glycosyltransferase involved in cell wall biosynthesis